MSLDSITSLLETWVGDRLDREIQATDSFEDVLTSVEIITYFELTGDLERVSEPIVFVSMSFYFKLVLSQPFSLKHHLLDAQRAC